MLAVNLWLCNDEFSSIYPSLCSTENRELYRGSYIIRVEEQLWPNWSRPLHSSGGKE